MEVRITNIREAQNLPVAAMGEGVSLVADDGIEYIVDPGVCSCGGGRRRSTCTHMEAADVGACGLDRDALAYHYLLIDEALERLVEAREALAGAAMGEHRRRSASWSSRSRRLRIWSGRISGAGYDPRPRARASHTAHHGDGL
jgi:hypothetical protein